MDQLTSLPSILLQDGDTALIAAAMMGCVDIVQTLVDYGAAVDLTNKVTIYKIIDVCEV